MSRQIHAAIRRGLQVPKSDRTFPIDDVQTRSVAGEGQAIRYGQTATLVPPDHRGVGDAKQANLTIAVTREYEFARVDGKYRPQIVHFPQN